jgi:hypothetical protein
MITLTAGQLIDGGEFSGSVEPGCDNLVMSSVSNTG